MSKRKVCVITGTRAEYGLLKPVMNQIKSSESLTLRVIATGMHLLPEFGLTVEEIEKDGFKIDARVPNVVGGDNKISMSISIGLGIIEISQSLEILNPDIVLVLGDRYETLAAAIAAVYSGRVLAHLCGGDSSEGGYDEYSRHAITKIAHLHLPMTKKSAKRIIQMGENPEYVHVVGYTSLDTILNKKLPSKQTLCEKYDLNSKEVIVLVVYHPVSTKPDKSVSEMKKVLEAVVELGYQTLVAFPNVDPGGGRMTSVINVFKKKFPSIIKVYRNFPHEDYLGLLKIVDVFVGNSSSGILEAPSFHLPFINIGVRQKGRERAKNVIDVDIDKNEIKEGIRRALSDEEFLKKVKIGKNTFGDGKSSIRIVEILENVELNNTLLRKKFHDSFNIVNS